jgi:hypothetical protein
MSKYDRPLDHSSVSASWIDNYNLDTVNSRTIDEMNAHPDEAKWWLQQYAAGKNDFQSRRIDQVFLAARLNSHVETIVATRLALEIPHRGSKRIDQKIILEAVGSTSEGVSPTTVYTYAYEEVFGMQYMHYEVLRQIEDTIPHTPGVPIRPWDIIKQLEEAKEFSYLMLGTLSDEERMSVWNMGIAYFQEINDTFGLGVACMELADLYDGLDEKDEARDARKAAYGLLMRRIKALELDQTNPIRNLAELDTLTAYVSSLALQ